MNKNQNGSYFESRLEALLKSDLETVQQEIEARRRGRPNCPCDVLTLSGRLPCEEGQDCPTLFRIAVAAWAWAAQATALFVGGEKRVEMLTPEQSRQNMIRMGYFCGAFSLLVFPLGLGVAGLVIGIINLARGEVVHGVFQIVIACVCAGLGMIIGASLSAFPVNG